MSCPRMLARERPRRPPGLAAWSVEGRLGVFEADFPCRTAVSTLRKPSTRSLVSPAPLRTLRTQSRSQGRERERGLGQTGHGQGPHRAHGPPCGVPRGGHIPPWATVTSEHPPGGFRQHQCILGILETMFWNQGAGRAGSVRRSQGSV